MFERQTVLAYALALHKARHGRYPETLDANQLGVSADVLVDPYSQKPFTYDVKDGKRRVVAFEPMNLGGTKIVVAGKPYNKTTEHALELP